MVFRYHPCSTLSSHLFQFQEMRITEKKAQRFVLIFQLDQAEITEFKTF